MTIRPLTVCIPVFDPGPHLVPAIESVLSQSFEDFDLLIVDDFSREPVEAIVNSYHDDRIRYVRNRCNLGLVDNWNKCIALSEGEFVAIFHQDDVMHRNNLYRKIDTLRTNPSAGFVYSNILRVDANGEVIGGHWLPQPEVDSVLSGRTVFKMIASSGNPISCPSVVARRSCYEHVGMFDSRLAFAVDLEMWMRIATVYDIAYIAEPLISQRVHRARETENFQGKGKDYLDVLRAFDTISSQGLTPEYADSIGQAYLTLCNQALLMSRWQLRQRQIVSSLRYGAVALLAIQRSWVNKGGGSR